MSPDERDRRRQIWIVLGLAAVFFIGYMRGTPSSDDADTAQAASAGPVPTADGDATSATGDTSGSTTPEPGQVAVPDDIPEVVVADTVQVDEVIEHAGPHERVYVVSDSVGLSARSQIPAAFPDHWSVVVEGTPALFVEQLEERYVRPRSATNPEWLSGHVVVAGGYNYPYWDPARFDRSIDSMVTTLTAAGAEHVYWVTLREIDPRHVSVGAWRQAQPFAWYLPIVNDHLERAADRHPQLTLVDWAARANQPGLTYDAIHLNQTGATAYAELVRQTIDTAERRAPAGVRRRIAVPGAQPGDVVAVNLTTVAPRSTGFLVADACGDEPAPISNHNHRRDQVVAAASIIPVGDGSHICVLPSTDTHVIVDVAGRFPVGDGIVPLLPDRVADTRTADPSSRLPAGEQLEIDVIGPGRAPDRAAGVIVSLTAVGADQAGFATIGPCGDPTPETSTVNYGVAAATPNMAVVRPGADGLICAVASSDANLVVDLLGAFEPEADVDIGPPRRVADTRVGGTPVAAGSTTVIGAEQIGVPDDSGAWWLNLTATETTADGFVTAYPCLTGLPVASNLNIRSDRDVANAVTVAPDANGEICLHSTAETHLVVDLLGTAGTTFEGRRPVRIFDSRG